MDTATLIHGQLLLGCKGGACLIDFCTLIVFLISFLAVTGAGKIFFTCWLSLFYLEEYKWMEILPRHWDWGHELSAAHDLKRVKP